MTESAYNELRTGIGSAALLAGALRGVAGQLRRCVRGCEQHEADNGALTNRLLDGWATTLEVEADRVLTWDLPKIFDAVATAEERATRAEAEADKHKRAVATAKKKAADAVADLKVVQAKCRELHEANLARPEVKPFTDAIMLLLMDHIRVTPDDERDRLRLIETADLGQAALRHAGSACDFPVVPMAYQRALVRHGFGGPA